MAGNPTGAMGSSRLSRLGLGKASRHPDRVRPGLPIHPDNLSETLTYLLYIGDRGVTHALSLGETRQCDSHQ